MKSSSKALIFCLLIGMFVASNCEGNNNKSIEAITVQPPEGDTKPALPSAITNSIDSTSTVLPTTSSVPLTTSSSETPVIPTSTIVPQNDTTTKSSTTTTSSSSTTITEEPQTTTTLIPPTPPTTTPSPSTTSTTIKPNSTTTVPPTSTTEKPGPTPPCNRFDGSSFIGGIVLTLGLLSIGIVAYKFYKARNERNYHTL